MYPHQLKGMVDQLVRDKIIPNEQEIRLSARESLGKYWSNKIAISWHVDDVIDGCGHNHPDITEEDARNILAEVHHKMTYEEGVSWDTVQSHTNLYMSGKNEQGV